MGIAHVQLTPTSKHLPVHIYIHSTLIEPVETTAFQLIIIIDHCVIHSPRLNKMIYLFKKIQRMETSIQGTQDLVWNMFISSFVGKLLCLFWISKPHVNLFLPFFTWNSFVSEFPLRKQLLMPNQEYIQDSAPLPHYKLQVGCRNHKIFKCSAIELIESTSLLLDSWLIHTHRPK